MSKYIDADAIYKSLGMSARDIEIAHMIEEAPSIDLVPCRECRRIREDGAHANCGGYLYCRKWKTLVDEDSYCSWGEREGE